MTTINTGSTTTTIVFFITGEFLQTSGAGGGDIILALFTNADETLISQAVMSKVITDPGFIPSVPAGVPFSFDYVPMGTFWLRAYRDFNGNGLIDSFEGQAISGTYASPTMVDTNFGNVNGLNMVFETPLTKQIAYFDVQTNNSPFLPYDSNSGQLLRHSGSLDAPLFLFDTVTVYLPDMTSYDPTFAGNGFDATFANPSSYPSGNYTMVFIENSFAVEQRVDNIASTTPLALLAPLYPTGAEIIPPAGPTNINFQWGPVPGTGVYEVRVNQYGSGIPQIFAYNGDQFTVGTNLSGDATQDGYYMYEMTALDATGDTDHRSFSRGYFVVGGGLIEGSITNLTPSLNDILIYFNDGGIFNFNYRLPFSTLNYAIATFSPTANQVYMAVDVDSNGSTSDQCVDTSANLNNIAVAIPGGTSSGNDATLAVPYPAVNVLTPLFNEINVPVSGWNITWDAYDFVGNGVPMPPNWCYAVAVLDASSMTPVIAYTVDNSINSFTVQDNSLNPQMVDLEPFIGGMPSLAALNNATPYAAVVLLFDEDYTSVAAILSKIGSNAFYTCPMNTPFQTMP